ncbi:probable cyclic nucleotide-gated ion channel 16 isoform X1 [Brassica napus]|uniref:probable cyclic nucleotide-gated ion channel 16 isoform X1 n=1 Tax=Brassica napus TaxID=3708 RepID=UPI0004F15988|nr:probable cyclic nucleotide-gated ion channel 16 isoform X1 [Brassica napus]XP_048623017.1 probable cyclic nucleotide-gated ion channel 16 isoform X1 [Brassica napus]
MRHMQLPQKLQERVRWFVQYKWLTTRGVDEEAILRALPLDLPLSTRTVRSLSEVEAFALRAEDLKFVANQFRRLHSNKLQHAFRYYLHQWRAWGTGFIQAAWRRYMKRNLSSMTTRSERCFDYCSRDV